MNKTENQIIMEKPAVQDENNQVGGELNFDNMADVLRYLENNGWQITRPSLYRHGKEGKLRPETGGAYKQKAVDRYARTFLKLAATGKRFHETSDNLQRQKLEEELKNLRLKNDRDKFNYEKDRGLYVPKNEVDLDRAALAGILIAGMKNWIMSNAGFWIDLTSGDNKKVGELIHAMNSSFDAHINTYAGKNQEYEVIFEADSESQPKPEDVLNVTDTTGDDPEA